MEITPNEAIEMLSFIPSRPDYENWIKVISAIGNHFSEHEALSILRTRFIDETSNETQRKLRNRLKNISIGTLVYYAKQNGYKSTLSAEKSYTVQSGGTTSSNRETQSRNYSYTRTDI
jgi:hypothetical protein